MLHMNIMDKWTEDLEKAEYFSGLCWYTFEGVFLKLTFQL